MTQDLKNKPDVFTPFDIKIHFFKTKNGNYLHKSDKWLFIYGQLTDLRSKINTLLLCRIHAYQNDFSLNNIFSEKDLLFTIIVKIGINR